MVELDPSSIVQLRTARRANLDLDIARKVLEAPELDWLGVPSQSGTRRLGHRVFRCDLRLPLHAVGHEVEFRKAAIVDLGPVTRTDGDLSVEIAWRSTNLAPLFPVFAGHLTVRPDGLILDGWYAPPAGRLGLALDRALLGIAARRTAVWFLGVMADVLSGGGRR